MSIRALPIALLFLTNLATPVFCQNSPCSVILKNGNKIEANSYRIQGRRVYLKYPVGEAAFELSQVESITDSNGSALLQDKGAAQSQKGSSWAQKPAQPSQPAAHAAGSGRPFATLQEQEMTADENPAIQAEKEKTFQDFFDKYWKSDEKEQAEMEKKADKVFSDYLATPYTFQAEKHK